MRTSLSCKLDFPEQSHRLWFWASNLVQSQIHEITLWMRLVDESKKFEFTLAVLLLRTFCPILVNGRVEEHLQLTHSFVLSSSPDHCKLKHITSL